MTVRGLVFSIDRSGQRFDRGHVEATEFFGFAAFGFDALEMDLVGQEARHTRRDSDREQRNQLWRTDRRKGKRMCQRPRTRSAASQKGNYEITLGHAVGFRGVGRVHR